MAALTTTRPFGPFGTLLLLSTAMVGSSLVAFGWRVALTSEWAGPDLASSVSLALLAVWLCWQIMQGPRRLWPLPAAAALLSLRELDFQNWFFEPGLVRIELLTGPAPLWQKAIGLAVAVLIAVTLIALGRVGAAPFWRALRARTLWALALAGSLMLLAVVTQLDGLGGDLVRAGFDVSAGMRTALLMAEEGGEMLFALGLALAADLGLRART